MHCCPHCQRNYQRKIYYDRHVGVCEFLCKSKKGRKQDIEENNDTPTIRELYMVVMELVVKNKQLEEKLHEMSKMVNIKKQKLNINDWLNMTYPDVMDYTAWLSEVKVTQEHMNTLFETDYVGGVTSSLKQQLLLGNDRRPIRAFASKDNGFYLYNQAEKKWLMMDNETYLKLMYVFDKKVMVEFGNWQRENKEKLYTDSFSLIYNKHTKKVMASREPLYSRIKRELYSYLRQELPQMMEYEVTCNL